MNERDMDSQATPWCRMCGNALADTAEGYCEGCDRKRYEDPQE